MSSTLAKIVEIEAGMAQTQKDKATAYHLGLLKARLAKLRGGGSGPGEGFDVAKTGDAQIGLVGFPSVGKSTLLSNLAGVYSKVAAYEFTTLTTVPSVILYKGAKIQLEGIIEGAKDGKGRGRQVIAVARTRNLILIVLDVLKPLGHKKIIENELEAFGVHLNSKPPNIGFKKKDKGGINLMATCPQSELDAETVKSILAEYKIHNADVTLPSDATADDLIDVVEGNRVYIPCIYVLNKIDQISTEELVIIYKVPHCIPISAPHRYIIYTKPKGQLPDYTSLVVLPYSRTTVDDFCMKIHKNLIKEFQYALVWGLSVEHNPQKVGKAHTLEDEDVIQIVKK
uniref:OBG-type G domain-containing protein n=1 Tax=Propithecus coquereli TaxID=379532 RepID=A0A2K6GRL9_PROCO